MHLSHLRMTDFRGFASAEIEFDSSISLLVGENGAGKSTLLRGAMLLLAQVVRDCVKDASLRLPKLENEDQRNCVQILPNGRKRLVQTPKCSIEGRLLFQGESYSVSCGKKTQDALAARFAKMVEKEKCLPVFAFYGAHRGAIRKHISNKKKKPIDYFNPASAYMEALSADAEFQQFVDWFKRGEEDELRDMREGWPPSRELDAVRRALELLFYDSKIRYVKPRVLSHGLGLVFTAIDADGNMSEKSFDELSDGYRSMVALVADFARRLAIANQETETDPLLGAGVLLVDEIDLHLHPRWQQRVLHDLHRTFPNVQIITSTHAPEVIASVSRENVYRFVPTPDRSSSVTLEHPDFQTSGMGCEDVLPMVMEVSSQPPTEISEKFVRCCELLRDCREDSEEAVQLKQWLSEHLEENHPRMLDILRLENRNRFLRKLGQRKH